MKNKSLYNAFMDFLDKPESEVRKEWEKSNFYERTKKRIKHKKEENVTK